MSRVPQVRPRVGKGEGGRWRVRWGRASGFYSVPSPYSGCASGGPRSSRAGGMLRGPSGSGGVSQGGAGDGEARRDSRAGLRGPLCPGFRWDSPSWLWGQGQGLRGGEGRRLEDGGHGWDVVRAAWVRRSRQS